MTATMGGAPNWLVAMLIAACAVALINGSTLSVSGLNITVADCQLTMAGTTGLNCSAGNLEFLATTGPNASIKIEGVDGGNLFSAALGSGLYDVSFTLNITASVVGTKVSAVSLGIAGSTTSTGTCTVSPCWPFSLGNLVSAGESVSVAGSTN
jgi:hypothetical protein